MKNWIDGKERDMLGGLGGQFGSILPDKADQSVKAPAVSPNPIDCCSSSTLKVSHPLGSL